MVKENFKNVTQIIVFYFIVGNCFALTGNGANETSIETVTSTARSRAMGSVGYALSDDETCLIYNPAGLGFMNFRWNGGAISYTNTENDFYSPKNLYTITYQNENLNRLGFSGCLARTESSMTSMSVDSQGNMQVGKVDRFIASVYGVGAGYRFYSNKLIDNSIGISFNYSQFLQDASLGPTETRVLGNIGYILQIHEKFRIGLSFKNIDISNSNCPNLSTAFCSGFGYKDSFNGKELRILDISAELSYVDWISATLGPNSIQTGVEATLFNILSARFGYLDFPDNSRYSLSFGTGINLFNHLNVDLYWVYNRDIYNYKQRIPFGFSLSFNRILKWNKSDLKWWLK